MQPNYGNLVAHSRIKSNMLRVGRKTTPTYCIAIQMGTMDKLVVESRPISRVLSWAIIHLGLLSPASSSDLPEDIAGRDIAFLFGLAPGGVYHATSCYQLRGALLPHHFTLTCRSRRFIFCCTFRRLTPPRNYLAPCPVEPGLSSPFQTNGRNGAIAWPAPGFIFSYWSTES